MRTYRIKPAVVNKESLSVVDRQDICCRTAKDKLGRVVHGALGNGVRQFSRWVPGTVKNVCDGITSFIAAKVSPDNLHILSSAGEYELSDMRPTAVTFGWSAQGSMIKGPTELVTTMVLLF
jgi:hypothetical protein